LRERLVRSDLRALMERMDTRLGDAARAAHAHGIDCGAFAAVAHQLVEILEDRGAYLDDEQDWRPDAAIDEEVAGLFEQFTSGWMEAGEATHAAGRLRRALAAHRV